MASRWLQTPGSLPVRDSPHYLKRISVHKPAVILRSIRKSFPLRNVLDGLNMTVDEGDLFGIIGPKGSGKTTALRVILGQTRFQGGKVIFGPQYGGGLANGRAICESILSEPFIPGIAIARYLKMLPFYQNPSNWENTLAAFAVTGFNGCEQRYRDLSALQKRRLAIALALVREPKILLLDNPFNNLEESDKVQLGQLLRKLNQSHAITIIFTTESLEDAKHAASRCVFFKNGVASRPQTLSDI